MLRPRGTKAGLAFPCDDTCKLMANLSVSVARKVWGSPLLPNDVSLTLFSKTFLARLCEQAERYDGKLPCPLRVGMEC